MDSPNGRWKTLSKGTKLYRVDHFSSHYDTTKRTIILHDIYRYLGSFATPITDEVQEMENLRKQEVYSNFPDYALRSRSEIGPEVSEKLLKSLLEPVNMPRDPDFEEKLCKLEDYLTARKRRERRPVMYFFNPDTFTIKELVAYCVRASVDGPAILVKCIVNEDIEIPYMTDPSTLKLIENSEGKYLMKKKGKMVLCESGRQNLPVGIVRETYGANFEDVIERDSSSATRDYKIAEVACKMWGGFISDPVHGFHGEMALTTEFIGTKIVPISRMCVSGLYENIHEQDDEFASKHYRPGYDNDIAKMFDECCEKRGDPYESYASGSDVSKKIQQFIEMSSPQKKKIRKRRKMVNLISVG